MPFLYWTLDDSIARPYVGGDLECKCHAMLACSGRVRAPAARPQSPGNSLYHLVAGTTTCYGSSLSCCFQEQRQQVQVHCSSTHSTIVSRSTSWSALSGSLWRCCPNYPLLFRILLRLVSVERPANCGVGVWDWTHRYYDFPTASCCPLFTKSMVSSEDTHWSSNRSYHATIGPSANHAAALSLQRCFGLRAFRSLDSWRCAQWRRKQSELGSPFHL